MKGSERMDVFLVSGFLGSGKTTLIRHLLTSKGEGLGKIALIVNEVGRIGVDGALLSGQNVDMVELTSGCVCCTMKTDFLRAIQEIHDRISPDILIVEATGVAQPADILDAFFDPPLSQIARLRSLITVVGSDIFEAREVFGPFYRNQITCADLILLNKVDLVSAEFLQGIKASLREMNAEAPILVTQYCAVETSLLLQVSSDGPRAHAHGHPSHHHLDEYGFMTFSFEDDRPLDKSGLKEFLQFLPPNLFRLKGWVRFSDGSALLDFAAGRYRISPVDGSRATALTFVGRHCNEREILDALKKCLIRELSHS
ncbi:MAG: GTP-binding protein [Pseudomonadota bacterium]